YEVQDHPVIAGVAVEKAAEVADSKSANQLERYKDQIKAGAFDEDITDHVYGLTYPNQTVNHFWDADAGPNTPVDMDAGIWPNAWQKAKILWNYAVSEYQNGNEDQAYQYLGHVAHLLADMSVPAHAHEDPHTSFSDSYEDYMAATGTYSSLNSPDNIKLLNTGPVDVPTGTLENQLYYLFYTTNQLGDFFASDHVNGDNTYDHALMNPVYADIGLDVTNPSLPRTTDQLADNAYGNNHDGDLSTIAHYNCIYAIRATAALFLLFEKTVNTPPVGGAGADKYLVPTAASLNADLQNLRTSVSAATFVQKDLQQTYKDKITSVQKMIDSKDYAGARDKLKTDLLVKTDGSGSDDWITAGHENVQSWVKELIADLTWL
ncbi:MAG: hypothetical protein ACXVI3_05975, partial [Halobacteriota archaeon]